MALFFSLFFFFQAEDGIRDTSVTGVQTCALPILVCESELSQADRVHDGGRGGRGGGLLVTPGRRGPRDPDAPGPVPVEPGAGEAEIGRASCRERVEGGVGAGAVEENAREWSG